MRWSTAGHGSTESRQRWARAGRSSRGARRRLVALATLAGSLLGVTACTSGPLASSVQRDVPLTLEIGPTPGATDQLVSSEIPIQVEGGKITDVTLTKSGTAEKVSGAMREDGSAWVPDKPLEFNTPYDASVTALSEDGRRTETRTTSFTTMRRFTRTTDTGFYMAQGQTVGVAMPVVIQFMQPVPAAQRAEVQRRLFVTTDPPQPGVWHWPSGNQVWYRAPNYWQPGTKISVRAALYGVPTGAGRYGDADRGATVTVGEKVFINVDNATKTMKVYQNDQLTRQMPVSLGKASTPSSSGHMVTMSHQPRATFDTRGEAGVDQYVVTVSWAMRLTWGGEFIHSAPWSVGDQGRRNVSHGCVNLSPANAKWLFDITHVGDPVIVRGTEKTLVNDNGWNAWNMTWPEYIKGSALPVPPDLASAQGVDPLTGASPENSANRAGGPNVTHTDSGPTPAPTA